jgi:hypothetical protein
MTQDRAAGLVIAVMSLFFLGLTLNWPQGQSQGRFMLTPYFFPRIISCGMLFCGAALIIFKRGDRLILSIGAMYHTLQLLGLFALCVLAAVISGWDLFVGMFFLCSVLLFISKTPILRASIISALIAASVFFVFQYIFRLPLPSFFM